MRATPIRLNHHSGEAVYRQIIDQLKFQVASGRLSPGERLPSIRVLAAQLSINNRTVVKAYEELARDGLVVIRHGQGAFVLENGGIVSAAARRKELTRRARQLLADASTMGASLGDVLETIRRVGHDMGIDDE